MANKFVVGLIIGSLASFSCWNLINYSMNSLHALPVHLQSSQDQQHQMYAHPRLIISTKAQWTTVEAIEQSLKDTPPMHVGFDIDDTVLFPNTSFYMSINKHCPHDTTPGHKKCMHKQAFWDELNASSEFSPPKDIGKRLIQMHKKRGDTIYFITAREKSRHQPENLSQTLNNVFSLTNTHDVIYVGVASINVDKPGKTQSIMDNNIKVFYGDSDADIAAAIAAKARGIRVMRAPNSQDNFSTPINGRFGEEVIIGSDI